MKVAKPTTRPRRTFDDDVEMAALEWLVEDTADADGTADEVEAPVLLRAALRSLGIIKGVDPAEPRFTDPSGWITSLLAARKVRVYMMFSAA